MKKGISKKVTSNTSLASILCFLAAAFSGALGQYLYKSGADAAGSGWRSYVLNWQLALGVRCCILVMVLFVAAFRIGGRMTVLYPICATTFIRAALIA